MTWLLFCLWFEEDTEVGHRKCKLELYTVAGNLGKGKPWFDWPVELQHISRIDQQ